MGTAKGWDMDEDYARWGRDRYGRKDHEARLDHLVDQEALHSDAYYRTMVSLFRAWLTTMEDAMKDEGIERQIAQRVLNRVVYGGPSAADAHLRIEMETELRDALSKIPPSVKIAEIDRLMGVKTRDSA